MTDVKQVFSEIEHSDCAAKLFQEMSGPDPATNRMNARRRTVLVEVDSAEIGPAAAAVDDELGGLK
jgi:hypothetical protein